MRSRPHSGAQRSVPNAPRVLDLDLLAYGELVRPGPQPPLLPHPRMAERAFVLLSPGARSGPDWRHPATGHSLAELIARLAAGTGRSTISALRGQAVEPA